MVWESGAIGEMSSRSEEDARRWATPGSNLMVSSDPSDRVFRTLLLLVELYSFKISQILLLVGSSLKRSGFIIPGLLIAKVVTSL